MTVILFNKPFGVMTQFTPHPTRPTLKEYIALPRVYPAGRLDADSEGLVVLTDEGNTQARLSDPRHKLAKTYWVQVEGEPTAAALERMRAGLDLGDFVTQPCGARVIAEPEGLWPRNPPIRQRRHIPTCWLEVILREGKNRQVRRMTAKVGFPTLRLIRWSVGPYTLADLAPGETRIASADR